MDQNSLSELRRKAQIELQERRALEIAWGSERERAKRSAAGTTEKALASSRSMPPHPVGEAAPSGAVAASAGALIVPAGAPEWGSGYPAKQQRHSPAAHAFVAAPGETASTAERDGMCMFCGASSIDDSSFCWHCGKLRAGLCPKCGDPMNADVNLCPRCGKQNGLSADDRRREREIVLDELRARERAEVISRFEMEQMARTDVIKEGFQRQEAQLEACRYDLMEKEAELLERERSLKMERQQARGEKQSFLERRRNQIEMSVCELKAKQDVRISHGVFAAWKLLYLENSLKTSRVRTMPIQRKTMESDNMGGECTGYSDDRGIDVGTLRCSCGNIFMDDAKVCRRCGKSRCEESCHICDNVFMDDSVFCRKCGTRRSPQDSGLESPEGVRCLSPTDFSKDTTAFPEYDRQDQTSPTASETAKRDACAWVIDTRNWPEPDEEPQTKSNAEEGRKHFELAKKKAEQHKKDQMARQEIVNEATKEQEKIRKMFRPPSNTAARSERHYGRTAMEDEGDKASDNKLFKKPRMARQDIANEATKEQGKIRSIFRPPSNTTARSERLYGRNAMEDPGDEASHKKPFKKPVARTLTPTTRPATAPAKALPQAGMGLSSSRNATTSRARCAGAAQITHGERSPRSGAYSRSASPLRGGSPISPSLESPAFGRADAGVPYLYADDRTAWLPQNQEGAKRKHRKGTPPNMMYPSSPSGRLVDDELLLARSLDSPSPERSPPQDCYLEMGTSPHRGVAMHVWRPPSQDEFKVERRLPMDRHRKFGTPPRGVATCMDDMSLQDLSPAGTALRVAVGASRSRSAGPSAAHGAPDGELPWWAKHTSLHVYDGSMLPTGAAIPAKPGVREVGRPMPRKQHSTSGRGGSRERPLVPAW